MVKAFVILSALMAVPAFADNPEYIKDVNGDMIQARGFVSTDVRPPDKTAVPEPTTIALVAMGLAGLALKKKKAKD